MKTTSKDLKLVRRAIIRAYDSIVDAYKDSATLNRVFADKSNEISIKLEGIYYDAKFITIEELNALNYFSCQYGAHCLSKARAISRQALFTNIVF